MKLDSKINCLFVSSVCIKVWCKCVCVYGEFLCIKHLSKMKFMALTIGNLPLHWIPLNKHPSKRMAKKRRNLY